MTSANELLLRAGIIGHLGVAFGFPTSTETIKESVRLTMDIPLDDLRLCASNIVQENKRPASLTGALREEHDALLKRRWREAHSADPRAIESTRAELKAAVDAGLPTSIDGLFNPPGIWDRTSHVSGRPMGPANQPSKVLNRLLEVQYGADWPERLQYPDAWKVAMEHEHGPDWRRVWTRPEGWPPFAENPRPSPKRLNGDSP